MSKKYITVGAVAVLTMALLVPAAYGCGGHGRMTAGQSANENTNMITCNVCTMEDCQIAGRHSHDGILYCGYDHADGICDGSCQVQTQTPVNTGRHHGHRGHH